MKHRHQYKAHPANSYAHYYQLCRDLYGGDNPDHSEKLNNLEYLTIDEKNFFSIDTVEDSIFNLGSEYKSLITDVADLCGNLLVQQGRDTMCTKHLDGSELSRLSPQFNTMFDRILTLIMPTIEREYAGAYCRPWYVSTCRSILRPPLPDDSGNTWQWHSDMVPATSFKLFFHLTDVDENSAPFTYLVDPQGRSQFREGDDWRHISKNNFEEHAKINPPRSQACRIPIAEINALKEEGYIEKEAHLPAGSFMIFSQNYYHKATIPTTTTRDVLQVSIRPVLKKPESYWFGSNAQTHANAGHAFDWWAYD